MHFYALWVRLKTVMTIVVVVLFFFFLFCFCLLEWLGSIEGRDEQCCIIIIITGKVCTCMRYCKWSDWAWENASSFFVCWNDIKKLVPSICHVCSVRVCVCICMCRYVQHLNLHLYKPWPLWTYLSMCQNVHKHTFDRHNTTWCTVWLFCLPSLCSDWWIMHTQLYTHANTKSTNTSVKAKIIIYQSKQFKIYFC